MSRTIAHRELRNNSSEVLRQVQAGETFTITNHGEVVALLVPPTTVQARIRPASINGGFSTLARVKVNRTVEEDLDFLRSER